MGAAGAHGRAAAGPLSSPPLRRPGAAALWPRGRRPQPWRGARLLNPGVPCLPPATRANGKPGPGWRGQQGGREQQAVSSLDSEVGRGGAGQGWARPAVGPALSRGSASSLARGSVPNPGGSSSPSRGSASPPRSRVCPHPPRVLLPLRGSVPPRARPPTQDPLPTGPPPRPGPLPRVRLSPPPAGLSPPPPGPLPPLPEGPLLPPPAGRRPLPRISPHLPRRGFISPARASDVGNFVGLSSKSVGSALRLSSIRK